MFACLDTRPYSQQGNGTPNADSDQVEDQSLQIFCARHDWNRNHGDYGYEIAKGGIGIRDGLALVEGYRNCGCYRASTI